jgi:hypothetical protein
MPDEEEEVLELGARRGGLPTHRVVLVLLLAAALAGYLGFRHQNDEAPKRRAVPTAAPPSVAPTVTPGPTALSPELPPWPRRDGVCSTAFLPLVSAHRLDRRTGIRALVGDRLSTVDVDTGAVRPAAGLPRGRFASDVVTTADGTYALLRACDQSVDDTTRVVRLDAAGRLHTVAGGKYEYLLAGGSHVWGVRWSSSGERISVTPVEGGHPHWLPAGFGPLGAYADLIVGTVNPSGVDMDAPFLIRVIDPATGRTRLQLGPARSAALSNGVILWTSPGCTDCRLHVHDLATGRDTVTRRPVPGVASAWGAVVSPDRRTAAVVRPGSTPATYDMEHPGNPNVIVTVRLTTGRTEAVPGLVLWSKSNPGLAFSADGRWLLIGLDEGTGVRLIVWKPGLSRPLQSPARLNAKVAFAPSVATV